MCPVTGSAPVRSGRSIQLVVEAAHYHAFASIGVGAHLCSGRVPPSARAGARGGPLASRRSGRNSCEPPSVPRLKETSMPQPQPSAVNAATINEAVEGLEARADADITVYAEQITRSGSQE